MDGAWFPKLNPRASGEKEMLEVKMATGQARLAVLLQVAPGHQGMAVALAAVVVAVALAAVVVAVALAAVVVVVAAAVVE